MKGRTSFHNSFNLQKDCNEKKSMSLEIVQRITAPFENSFK